MDKRALIDTEISKCEESIKWLQRKLDGDATDDDGVVMGGGSDKAETASVLSNSRLRPQSE